MPSFKNDTGIRSLSKDSPLYVKYFWGGMGSEFLDFGLDYDY